MDASWRAKAKCRGLDPNHFVPAKPGGSLKRVYEICNGSERESPCQVRAECNQFATDNDLVGVFGGRMHSQRRVVKTVEVFVEITDARPRITGQAE